MLVLHHVLQIATSVLLCNAGCFHECFWSEFASGVAHRHAIVALSAAQCVLGVYGCYLCESVTGSTTTSTQTSSCIMQMLFLTTVTVM